MKSIIKCIFLSLALLLRHEASAFTAPSVAFARNSNRVDSQQTSTSLFVYVPDGLTKEEYAKIKKQESMKTKGKNLGRLGPSGFKSRSMESWQKAYEQGETGHAFAPFQYREKLSKGLLRREDIPYMVRGGNWDNSDVRGARRLKWLKEDREYARGGYKKEQSASILGGGPGFDWTGTRPREENMKKLVPGLS